MRALGEVEEEGDDETEENSRKQGMRIGAIEREEGGRASKFAQQVDVRDSAGDEHGNRRGARDAGESGALEGVGGERVGEWVHGRSYLTDLGRQAIKGNKKDLTQSAQSS